MTTKSELITNLKAALAAVEAMPDDAPVPPVNPVFVPKAGNRIQLIGMNTIGDGFRVESETVEVFPREPWKFAFRTREDAQAEADALNTFYELRAHPLRVPVVGGEYQETIGWDSDCYPVGESYTHVCDKTLGAYSDVNQVIKDVGADRIQQMIKTMMWSQ